VAHETVRTRDIGDDNGPRRRHGLDEAHAESLVRRGQDDGVAGTVERRHVGPGEVGLPADRGVDAIAGDLVAEALEVRWVAATGRRGHSDADATTSPPELRRGCEDVLDALSRDRARRDEEDELVAGPATVAAIAVARLRRKAKRSTSVACATRRSPRLEAGFEAHW
jgi:hypothetical protein